MEWLMIKSLLHHPSNMAEAVLWLEHVWLPMEPGHWYLLMMWLLIQVVDVFDVLSNCFPLMNFVRTLTNSIAPYANLSLKTKLTNSHLKLCQKDRQKCPHFTRFITQIGHIKDKGSHKPVYHIYILALPQGTCYFTSWILMSLIYISCNLLVPPTKGT